MSGWGVTHLGVKSHMCQVHAGGRGGRTPWVGVVINTKESTSVLAGHLAHVHKWYSMGDDLASMSPVSTLRARILKRRRLEMDIIEDRKYVVFRREEPMAGADPAAHIYAAGDAIEDAVVIRTQDLFAAAGLQAYAEVIRTGVALLEQSGSVIADPAVLDGLFEVAEYFESRAQEAADRRAMGECKLPG